MILYKQRGHVFFVYGFAKSEQANISPKELFAFKNLANLYAELSPTKLASALASRELIEVENDEDGTESEETHGA